MPISHTWEAEAVGPRVQSSRSCLRPAWSTDHVKKINKKVKGIFIMLVRSLQLPARKESPIVFELAVLMAALNRGRRGEAGHAFRGLTFFCWSLMVPSPPRVTSGGRQSFQHTGYSRTFEIQNTTVETNKQTKSITRHSTAGVRDQGNFVLGSYIKYNNF